MPVQQSIAFSVTATFDSQLSWSPGPPPAGVIGQPWSWQLPLPTGGNLPYLFSVTAGQSLPPGFTLSPAGLLSGTAAVPSLSFFITVSDTPH